MFRVISVIRSLRGDTWCCPRTILLGSQLYGRIAAGGTIRRRGRANLGTGEGATKGLALVRIG